MGNRRGRGKRDIEREQNKTVGNEGKLPAHALERGQRSAEGYGGRAGRSLESIGGKPEGAEALSGLEP